MYIYIHVFMNIYMYKQCAVLFYRVIHQEVGSDNNYQEYNPLTTRWCPSPNSQLVYKPH